MSIETYTDENGVEWVVTKNLCKSYFYQFKDRRGNVREIISGKFLFIFKLKCFIAKHFLIGGTEIPYQWQNSKS